MPVEKLYRVPFWNQALRFILKPLFQGLFHILARVRITGKENVPYGQPYVVAINHVSIYDPPFVLAFWPEMLEAMGAVDIWHKPGQNVLVRMYHATPVHRGDYDRELFDKVLGVLASGRPLVIAPEGGRSHATTMQYARPGLAYIVEMAKVPVVPVGIVGTTDDFWDKASRGKRPTLEMRIGKPLHLPLVAGRGDERRKARQSNVDLVMSHVAGLLPPEYRGVYAESAVVPESN
jgi:1-acyl-sn-glycerol-3-phosphate acyltransferase